MADVDVSGETKFRLKLIVDQVNNKVVFAEACKDFVDVLFSLLTLPMGAIVRLLEKYQKCEQPVTVGCFTNLYKSVVDMGIDEFKTEACKQMLLYPRSVYDDQCKRLKIKINPTEVVKCFKCPRYCNWYSNFNTSICRCGSFISEVIYLEDACKIQSDGEGVFVSGRCSFIITDDLKVQVKSTELVLEKLKSLGCSDVSNIVVRVLDISSEEFLTLLECMFSSNTPLTDMFLNKQSPRDVTKAYIALSPCMEGGEEKEVTLKAFINKQDMKVVFVECDEYFVELIISFLAIPFESVLEISGSNVSLGCVGNLFRSFKDLSSNQVSTAVLPCFYDFQMQLPGVITQDPPVYYRFRCLTSNVEYGLTTNGKRGTYYRKDRIVPVVLVDPKSDGSPRCCGFLKKKTKYTVSNDLTITSMNSCSTVCLLKKLQCNADNLDVQVINISKSEALNLLRASLVSTSPLNTPLWNLIVKKPKEETALGDLVSNKVKEET